MPARDGRTRLGRYLHISEIDRWRAVPFDMPPSPEHDTVLQRVRQLTESLAGAVDEGSGASLDRLVESWVGAWIATVTTEYTDHCGVIAVHRGQALEWLADSTHTAAHARAEYHEARADYLACKQRLSGGPAGVTGREPDAPVPGAGGPPGADAGPGTDSHPGAGPDAGIGPGPGMGADPGAGDAEPPTAQRKAAAGWAAPHLVAGRGPLALAVGGVLVLLGALTDTVAFQNTLQLALRTVSPPMAWLMAAGASAMALIAAGSLGAALAVHRRSAHPPPAAALIGAAVVWLGLGLAMFFVRWRGISAAAPSLGHHAAHATSSIWIAMFFAAIYLISGACTLFEAERLYNPEYFAFLRLRKRYHTQAARLAAAEATAERAQAALDLHDGELDREDQRRAAAIAERQALGAEAANHARILMAAAMRDPAKTGITETGPVPEMPTLSARPPDESEEGPGPSGATGAAA